MPEQNPEALKDSMKPKKLWKELSFFEIGLIIAMVWYFFYIANSTSLIVNINDGNSTRVINGVPNPPGTLAFGANDLVPKSNVSNSQVFFGIILFLVTIYVILSKVIKSSRRATIEEALEDISKQLISVRHMKQAKIYSIKNGLKITSEHEEIELTHSFITRYEEKGGEKLAFRYTINCKVHDKIEDSDEHYRAHYHPWSRYWDGFIRSESELEQQDQCPRCGKEYDVLVVLSDDLKKIKAAKEYIPGRL